MLKVYFVDDDELIIKELNSIIDYKEYGYEVCGYSNNSIDAKQEILDLNPSLVISDVQMDTINGLELAESIGKVNNKIHFCFLSCFDKFDYAVEAIRLGAIRYLKKPIRVNELQKLLIEIRDKEINHFSYRLSQILVNNDVNQNQLLNDLFTNSSLFLNNEKFRIVVLFGNIKEKINISSAVSLEVPLYMDNKMQIHVVYNPDFDALKIRGEKYKISIGISEERDNYKDISNLIKQARISSKGKFITDKEEFVIFKENDNINILLSKIKNVKKSYELKNTINELKKDIIDLNISANYIQNLYRVIVYQMIKLNVIEYDEDVINLSVLHFYQNIDQMIEDLLSNFEENVIEDYNSILINEIRDDIENNLSSKLSLSEYAKKYGYNTSYFSQWFKKKFDKPFAEYVIMLKIEKAKELMISRPNSSLRKIAIEVGYDDYYHFSKIFKKYTGLSPMEFSNNIIEE